MNIDNNIQALISHLNFQTDDSWQIKSDDPPPLPPNLAEFGGAVVSELQGFGDRMRQTLNQAFNDFLVLARQTAIENAAWQGIPENINLNELKAGQSYSPPNESLAALQKFLVGAGYLDSPDTPGKWFEYGKNFGDWTQEALLAFANDNGIMEASEIYEENGNLTPDMIDALRNPRPFVGYSPNSLDGSAVPQLYSIIEMAAKYFSYQLGSPLSGVVQTPDGGFVQYFERGTAMQNAEGSVSVFDNSGNALFDPNSEAVQTNYSNILENAGNHLLSQFEHDYDKNKKNNNCGFASLHMVLSYLGVEGYAVNSYSDFAEHIDETIVAANAENRETIMALRLAGDGGETDVEYGTPSQIETAALKISGVQADVWDLREEGVGLTNEQAVMQMQFALINNPSTAFVVAGNPSYGWGENSPGWEENPAFAGTYYNGTNPIDVNHFVAVIGYNPATDKFLVLDPTANAPIEITSGQMLEYMNPADDGASNTDVTQITYNP